MGQTMIYNMDKSALTTVQKVPKDFLANKKTGWCRKENTNIGLHQKLQMRPENSVT